jgi:hypothetical protein
MQSVMFNCAPLSDKARDDLLSTALPMLYDRKVGWQEVCTDDLMANVIRLDESKVHPEMLRKYPGVWFTATVTTVEVCDHPVSFVVQDDTPTYVEDYEHITLISFN